MRSLFVTGTGTGVGKTVVTAAICAAGGAEPMKPAQTGSLRAVDVEFVWSVTGRPGDGELSCPYRFEEPLAPAVAARRAGRAIDLDHIALCASKLAPPIVVEGAGGLLVPITDEATMADLAAALGLPLVVVVRPGLGTLNETALTVEAAEGRGLEVAGLVVSGYPSDPGVAERTNMDELPKISPILATIPLLPGIDVDTGSAGDLPTVADRLLDPRRW